MRKIIDGITGDDLKARRDRAIIEALFSTGLRVSELVSLKRPALCGDPTKTLELTIIGKGNWQRVVYFSPTTIKAVLRYFAGRKDDDERAFHCGVRMVQKIIRQRAKDAGMEGIHVHTLRHSFACHLLKKGANIFYVQNFLGHRSLSSTSVYLHATDRDLRELHEKIYASPKDK